MPDDGVSQVRCLWPFDHVEDFQLDVVAADVLEQAGAGAQQDRDQVDADLIDEAGPQQLLADAGAEDVDILAAGGGCCAGQGFARALDEGVHASLGHLWGRAVRDDERRGPRREAGPIRAPPRDGQVVGAPAGDTRAGTALAFGEDFAAAFVVAEGPLVQLLPAVPHRLFRPHTGRADVAVDRHADLKPGLAPRRSVLPWQAGHDRLGPPPARRSSATPPGGREAPPGPAGQGTAQFARARGLGTGRPPGIFPGSFPVAWPP